MTTQQQTTGLSGPDIAQGAPADLKVFVRMYRGLLSGHPYKGMLGDCFLIRIVQGSIQSTILIDCGLLLGSPEAKERMHAIAADIVKEAGGDLDAGRPGVIDLLVVTHEHWDHISGFSQAADIFFDDKKLRVANLWMAWTEDPEDETAKGLRARFDHSGAAFAALAQRLDTEVARFGSDASTRILSGMAGFLGATNGKSGKEAQLGGRDVMGKLKALGDPGAAHPAAVTFMTPGTALTTPGALGLHAYVLGPPKDLKKLFKDNPSTGAAQETYIDSPQVDGALLTRFSEGEDPDPARDSPFAQEYRRVTESWVEGPAKDVPPALADTVAWLRERYINGPDPQPKMRAYEARRRIDHDWLGAAGPLAMKLDSDTNNTSLVLVFDLPDGTAMLFAADAQVGNWLSWADQKYADPQGRVQTINELLARVRFYKVGHHGSHNATLDKQGLALMTRDDLVAAIPTDEDLGKQQGSAGWQMPNPRVKVALMERTKGRILRNDRFYSPSARAADPDLKDVEAAFFERLTEDDLYLEYQVI